LPQSKGFWVIRMPSKDTIDGSFRRGPVSALANDDLSQNEPWVDDIRTAGKVLSKNVFCLSELPASSQMPSFEDC
jgi:hypothetical protein